MSASGRARERASGGSKNFGLTTGPDLSVAEPGWPNFFTGAEGPLVSDPFIVIRI